MRHAPGCCAPGTPGRSAAETLASRLAARVRTHVKVDLHAVGNVVGRACRHLGGVLIVSEGTAGSTVWQIAGVEFVVYAVPVFDV